MRLLLVNPLAGCVGGAEIHLHHLIPGLRGRGHEVAFLHGHPPKPGSDEVPVAPADLTAWCLARSGREVLHAAQTWKPDLVYAHGLMDFAILEPLLERQPAVYFFHAYAGVCISGSRCLKSPVPQVCTRSFGPACLGLYLPRRCGGLSPWTMWRQYRAAQSDRTALRRFHRWLTHSEAVRQTYVLQGWPADRVRCVPFFVPTPAPNVDTPPAADAANPAALRLLYLGRFDPLKGGPLLLHAVPRIQRQLNRPVSLVMAGDGPARPSWQTLATKIAAESGDGIHIKFTGWLDGVRKSRALADADALVMPSVWPEPFGMVGLEAGQFGTPVVAFDLGGISTWLRPGVNGHFAPATPPTSEGLAAAVVKTVADPAQHASLRVGARTIAAQFTRDRHLDALEAEFEAVLKTTR